MERNAGGREFYFNFLSERLSYQRPKICKKESKVFGRKEEVFRIFIMIKEIFIFSHSNKINLTQAEVNKASDTSCERSWGKVCDDG